MRYIDLTHTFTDKMPTYFGDPPTSLTQITTLEKNGYVDHQLTTVMHVGTHMDAPMHMVDGGAYMSDIPLERFAGRGVLVDVRGKETIDIDCLSDAHISRGAIVLLLSGNDTRYGTKAYETTPVITRAFAERMVLDGVRMVGMDFLNPDVEETFPIHKVLLGAGVLIIENLTNVDSLLGIQNFDVFAFPIKLRAEAAPVRVVAAVK